MKKHILSFATLLMITGYLPAQKFSEKTVPLSKQATDGFLREASVSPDGGIQVYFDYREKKNNHTELYAFDPALNLTTQKTTEPPLPSGTVKENYTRDVIWANVGGSNSFDINSLKVKLFKMTYEYTWNKRDQRYYKNVIKRESVKVKGADDNNMDGYMAFGNSETGELFVLAGIEQKKSKKFSLLKVSNNLSFTEDAIPLTGNYTLVYAFAAPEDGSSTEDFDIAHGDMVFIFAPMAKSAQPNAYECLRYNNQGKLVSRISLKTPSPNTIFTSCRIQDNSMYLFGAYTKSKDAYEDVFGEFGNMVSPGYLSTEKLYGAENIRMFKYYKSLESEDPIAMVCAKISGSELVYMKDFSIKSLETFSKKAPNQKKAVTYNGKPLDIQQFQVLPNGDFMVAGQEIGRISVSLGEGAKAYKRLYCFHFNATGDLRAQYGVEPESVDDKFNTLFPILQQFVISKDQKNIYWLLLENVSGEGYETVLDQANGRKTWYARYFPSIITIDASQAELKSYEELGSRKYYLNKRAPFFYNEQERSFSFIGRDLKNKTLWVSKYKLD